MLRAKPVVFPALVVVAVVLAVQFAPLPGTSRLWPRLCPYFSGQWLLCSATGNSL